jgi:hypothetical protein
VLTNVRPLRSVTIVRRPLTVRLIVTPFAVWMDWTRPPGETFAVVPLENVRVVGGPVRPKWVPVGPVWVAPAEPVWVAPVEPVWVAPVEPVWVAPVEPEWVAPVEPVWVAPVEPVWVAPVEPVWVPVEPGWLVVGEPYLMPGAVLAGCWLGSVLVFAFAGGCAAGAALGAAAGFGGGLDLGLLSAQANGAISKTRLIDQFRATFLCRLMAFSRTCNYSLVTLRP